MSIRNGFWTGCVASAVLITAGLSALPAFAEDEPLPPGARQREYKGKLWPPFSRPTGKHAKWHDQYHYSHYWPYPQNIEDRYSVRAALEQQVNNGWIEETTLYDHHFDPVTQQLTNPGRLHLRWILLQTPPQHRTAFIQMTTEPHFDQARLASVQASATELLRGQPLPPIQLRQAIVYGTSAQEIDAMRRKYISSQPTPRLSIGGFGGTATQSSSSTSPNQ